LTRLAPAHVSAFAEGTGLNQNSEADRSSISHAAYNWDKHNVNWRTTGGGRIKAIYYPKTRPVPFRNSQADHHRLHYKKNIKENMFSRKTAFVSSAYVIDSPPIDGFIPWIVISVTDERLNELEFDAVPETAVVGRYPLGINPEKDYAIGIFDTGASIHLMGYADATRAGLFKGSPKLITSNTNTIAGVIGAVDVWVSQPLAIFIDGLNALDPNGLLDNSKMLGQSNVAIDVGQNPGDRQDLPTVIGTPFSVFFTTVIDNEQRLAVVRNDEEFSGPGVYFYENEDPCVPVYPNIVPLELRPSGATSVQYVPSLESFFEFPPASPSVIIGNLSQSLFFVHSVDLVEGENSAIDRGRFIIDTGAQITVIGSRIVARLKLNPNEPEFEAEIEDVTGETVIAPGFYIDSIQIPAIGEWLSYTNVPVVLIDVFSPEGGSVDGIIGTNLFIDFNLALRGGGLLLDQEPALYFEPVAALIADIAPDGGDGKVGFKDLSAFAKAWLAGPYSLSWNEKADIAPFQNPDGAINSLDLAVLAQYWLVGIR
jgi:hypothetical protein